MAPGDAEEACRRQVVTGDRDAVLRAGESASAGEELCGGGVLAARADHHEQRDDDEGREDRDVGDRVADGRMFGGKQVVMIPRSPVLRGWPRRAGRAPGWRTGRRGR